MIDWKIRSRSSECQACKVKFSDRQIYHTLLFAGGEENERIDVCCDCWDGQYGHGASDRKGFISHWTGTFIVPPPPPPEPIQKESADSALTKLVELGNPEHGPICFILSAMLERKRLLKVREELREGDKRGFVYENPKTGDVFTIQDPGLKLNELQDVQRDVAFLLEEGVDAFLAGGAKNEEGEASEDGTNDEGTESESGDESEREPESPEVETKDTMTAPV